MSDPIPVAAESLVRAELADLIPESEIYVRGRRAICVRVDYPHVFWRWAEPRANEQAVPAGREELHRSWSCTPEIFQVHVDQRAKRRAAEAAREAAHAGYHSDDDSPLHHDQEQQQQQHQLPSSDDDDDAPAPPPVPAPVPGPNRGANAAPEPNAARVSLMSMFSRRPTKKILSNVTDSSDEVIDAAVPESVSIESCARARFRIGAKVTSITLLNCEDVELEFLSVISSVELIRCRRCTIRCTQACGTYTLDESQNCTLAFPGYQPRVMCVSTNSTGAFLTAVPGGNPPPSADGNDDEKSQQHIDSEVEYHVDAAVAEAEAAGPQVEAARPPEPNEPMEVDPSIAAEAANDDSSAASGATKQFRTIWANGAFRTEILARQGILGYFTN